jgi:uncharacterized protein (TIGR03435 family)
MQVLTRSLVLAAAAASALAQPPPSTHPEFDAASIKPNKSGARAGGVRAMPGRIVGSNATAKMLLQEAFNVKSYQVSGGPGWIESDRFDIEAKAEGGVTEDQLRPMLQRLLAERFKLVVHRETKEMQVSALMVAKSGFKPHELKPGDPLPVPPPPPKEGAGGFIFVPGAISDLAAILSTPVGMPVLDKTGLQGKYLFNIAWAQDEDMVTAVLEQLGLKFESQKSPIELLVIDRLEKPDEN